MDKKEFIKLTMALKTYYPKDNLLPNDYAISLWYEQLKDLNYNLAMNGVVKYVSTNKFPPSIADIRECAVDVSGIRVADWGNGWEQVNRAIRVYGRSRADEALESMDDITRQVVKNLGFSNLCISINQTTDRANFRTLYEELAKKEYINQVLPAGLKKVIADNKKELLLEQFKKCPQ